MFVILGYIAGVLALLGDVPYIYDALKGHNKPHRVTWLTFFLLNLITVFNQRASGAHNSLWLVLGYTLATFIIAAVSIKKGVGGHTRLDMIYVAIIIFGLMLWAIFNNPLISLIANLSVATIAFIPTAKKAFCDPKSETQVSWLVSAIAATLATISVGKLDFRLMLFPLYSVVASGTIYVLIKAGEHSQKKS